MFRNAFRDDRAVADCAASLVQRGSEDCQEDDRRDDRLEGEEILDLGVWDAQERQLEQEVQEEGDES